MGFALDIGLSGAATFRLEKPGEMVQDFLSL